MALLIDLQKQHAGEKPPERTSLEQDEESSKFRKKPRKKQKTFKSPKLRSILLVLLFLWCAILFVLPVIVTQLDFSIADYEWIFGAIGVLTLLALLIVAINRSNKGQKAGKLSTQNENLANRLESLEDQAWEIRESEEIHRSLAEAFGDVVIHRDKAGNLSFSNKTFDQYFNDRSSLPAIQHNEAVALETRELELDTLKGKRWFAWTDLQVRDPQFGETGWRSVARDITERKHHEQELIDARQNAEIANEAKSSFLAMVSHEIRTPLNGVIGMAQLLEGTKLDATQQSYVDAVHTSGKTLLVLIEDLLDTAQIEAGHISLDLQPTRLGKLVEEVAEILSPRIREKQLSLATYIDPNIPDQISIDGNRLRQVLLNLAGNGVKFTEQGGVSIHARLQEHNKIEFSVEDTGPGLSKEDQSRIFEEFVQTDTSATRSHGGAGLGLAISQNLVKLMGGEIIIESRLGKGSRFSFAIEIHSSNIENNGKPENHHIDDKAEQALALILPRTPARKALSETAINLGYQIERFDSIASFISRPTKVDGKTSVIITHEDLISSSANLQKLRGLLDATTNIFLIGNAGQQEEINTLMDEGYDGWLTWPVRAKTLRKVLDGGVHGVQLSKQPSAPIEEKNHQPALNILLAEDNPINTLLAKSLLKKLGHNVQHVEDGAAAVETSLLNTPIDIIFMDLHMPVQDGASAIREIRDAEELSGATRCPIIVLSADGQASARDKALVAGADDFITKPLDLEAVIEIVNKVNKAKFL